MTLEVLVATMQQNDFSLVKKMNIVSNAIIANQGTKNETNIKNFEGYSVKMISTTTRGVGINRNIAFFASNSDIILFTDDDFIFFDGYEEAIIRAFEVNPMADIIVFDRDITKSGKVIATGNYKDKRVHIYNCLKYGACSLAVKRKSLLRAGVTFSQLFGGGCLYGSGEDSLFILECLRKGLKMYSSSYKLGECSQDSSTWFTGYNEKYFYDVGAWIACAFPHTKHLIKYYFYYRHLKNTNISAYEIKKYINDGIRGFKRLKPFN